MLDLGGVEVLIIIVVALVVLGPKELPVMVRSVMGFIRKIRMMAAEFQGTLDELAREADLQDIKKSVTELKQVGNNPTALLTKLGIDETTSAEVGAMVTDVKNEVQNNHQELTTSLTEVREVAHPSDLDREKTSPNG